LKQFEIANRHLYARGASATIGAYMLNRTKEFERLEDKLPLRIHAKSVVVTAQGGGSAMDVLHIFLKTIRFSKASIFRTEIFESPASAIISLTDYGQGAHDVSARQSVDYILRVSIKPISKPMFKKTGCFVLQYSIDKVSDGPMLTKFKTVRRIAHDYSKRFRHLVAKPFTT